MLAVVNEVGSAFNLLYEKLLGWLRQLVVMLSNLVVAVILLVLTFVVARLVQRVVQRLLPRVSPSVTLNNLVSTVLYVLTLLVGTFFVLTVLSLDKTVTSLLAGVGIIGLAGAGLRVSGYRGQLHQRRHHRGAAALQRGRRD